MIKIGVKRSDLQRLQRYIASIDRRTTAFFRGVSTHAARLAAIELNEQIDPEKDPLAKEYKDGIRSLRVADAAVIPREDIGRKKRMTNVREQHWAALAIRAHVTKANVLRRDKKTVIITVRPHKSRMTKAPKYIWPLVRYGPWTIDTIPIMPSKEDAVLTYKKVNPTDVVDVEKKNAKDMEKTLYLLSKEGKTVKSKKHLFKEIEAVEDLEYHVLRREFGLVAGQKPIWRPVIRRMRMFGPAYLLKTNVQLWRALFDPSYRGYGMLGRFSEIRKDDVKAFMSFQEKVR